MFALFLKGLIIGFAIAAPVGPIGILCIHRSLHEGFKIGLMTGLGAALADGTYGLVAGLGLTAISSLLIAEQFWIRVCGGVFLLYLGVKLILTKPREKIGENQVERSAWHACGTTYLLTLTNPATILSFVAVFAGLGLGTVSPGVMQAVWLVLGIVLGSAAWWMLLSGGVAFVLHRCMSGNVLRWINWVSGAVLVGFGVVALWV